jgi:hypothetical protein
MKMVKRSLIAIAVLAILATSVQALDYDDNGKIKRDGSWPTVYVALDLCTMPVVMDVGMYVQIFECEKRIIKLVQVDCADIGSDKFPCYLDCEEFDIRANFTAVLGTKLTKAEGSPIKDWEAYYDGEDTVPGDGVYYKRTVCVKAWDTEIWTAGPGDEVAVGSLTITVKPN